MKTPHEMDDGTAYVARAVSYTHKMFMKLTAVRFFHTSLIFMAKARVYPSGTPYEITNQG